METRRRGEPDAAVPVVVVVPGKERPQEAQAVLARAEAIGKGGPRLERVELRSENGLSLLV